VVDLDNLACGEVRALSRDVIVVRTAAGVRALPRACPHEGADLALGYLDGDSLHCAWHNLPIDVDTGAQPCRTLTDLQPHRLRRLVGETYEIGMPS
jgi:nitrite reductase/ring-hydroxylating ferredoxin subunit